LAYARGGDEVLPVWVADALAVRNTLPTLVYDSTNTTANGNLGFSAADTTLNANASVNQASAIDTSQFNADRFGWTNIYNRYNAGGVDAGACKDVGNGYSDLGDAFGKYPTADMLACIYNHEKTKKMSESAMWSDGQYLILHFRGDKFEWGGSNGPGGVLPAGVKILYFFSPSSKSPSSSFGCAAGLWYGGAFGSEQVIVSYTNMSGFAWNGTFYGFLYFNYPGTGQQQMLDCSDATLVGSWENASRTSSIWFPIDKATASLSIDYSSIRAKGVFSDIASSFSTSLGSDGNVAIRFSGDRNTSGPLTLSTKATLQDGWVQFERLGEFR
jgi:hypothetical protein